jgi:hypothetical protein
MRERRRASMYPRSPNFFFPFLRRVGVCWNLLLFPMSSQHVPQVFNVFLTMFSMISTCFSSWQCVPHPVPSVFWTCSPSFQCVPNHVLNDLNMFRKLALCSPPCSQWVLNMFSIAYFTLNFILVSYIEPAHRKRFNYLPRLGLFKVWLNFCDGPIKDAHYKPQKMVFGSSRNLLIWVTLAIVCHLPTYLHIALFPFLKTLFSYTRVI